MDRRTIGVENAINFWKGECSFFDLIDINGTENAKTTFMNALLFEPRLQRHLWALLAAILSNLDKILLYAQF